MPFSVETRRWRVLSSHDHLSSREKIVVEQETRQRRVSTEVWHSP